MYVSISIEYVYIKQFQFGQIMSGTIYMYTSFRESMSKYGSLCMRACARACSVLLEKNTKTNHGLNIALVVQKEVLLPICLSSLFEIFTNWQSFRLKIQFEVIKFKFTAIHVRCFRDLATLKVQFTCTAFIICFYPREVRWLSNLSVQTFVD